MRETLPEAPARLHSHAADFEVAVRALVYDAVAVLAVVATVWLVAR